MFHLSSLLTVILLAAGSRRLSETRRLVAGDPNFHDSDERRPAEMKNAFPMFLLVAMIAAVFLSSSAGAAGNSERPWRGGWCSCGETGKKFAVAKELGFNALITHGPVEKMKAFARLAKENGIESYYWFSIIWTGKDGEPPRQEMSAQEEEWMKALQADKDPRKHGYQFGGEPLPGHHDVLLQRLYCFDHPETAIYCREQIRRMLQACPDLTGVAFDFIGYQNYRCCH